MALLRLGVSDPGKLRAAILSNYDDNEPYMPGGGYGGPDNGDDYDDYDRDYDPGYDDFDPAYDDDYDDPAYDDGYDPAYDDGYGDGYDPGYDGGYGPGYDDGYGDPGYDPGYDDGYGPGYDDGYPAGALGNVLRYADAHDWVTWLLLLVFPPLGIWLLWRRQRYERNVSLALTAVSAIWLVLALVLLIWKPFSPKRDGSTTITPNPQPVGAALVATEAPEAEPTPAPASSVLSNEEVDEANAVYAVQGGPYYHLQQTCSTLSEGDELIRLSRNTAIDQSLMACPYCAASAYSDNMWDLTFVDAETQDKSGITVTCSAYNSFYHTDPNCSNLDDVGHGVPLKDALLMGKTACLTCCPKSGQNVYCTKDGTYCHLDPECSGMRNASSVTYAEARVIGKKTCPTCIGADDSAGSTGGDATAEAPADDSTYYVYATAAGKYYHIDPTCSGMANAKKYSLKEMLEKKRPACPVCCGNVQMTVYASPSNPYYHSNATCSGMTDAVEGVLVNALAKGLQRCPVCWTTSAEN